MKYSTTTVICCGSASGLAVSPFFVFEDKRMVNELMAGADCTVPYKDIQTVIDTSFFLNMDLAEIMTTYFLSLMDPSHKLQLI